MSKKKYYYHVSYVLDNLHETTIVKIPCKLNTQKNIEKLRQKLIKELEIAPSFHGMFHIWNFKKLKGLK